MDPLLGGFRGKEEEEEGEEEKSGFYGLNKKMKKTRRNTMLVQSGMLKLDTGQPKSEATCCFKKNKR